MGTMNNANARFMLGFAIAFGCTIGNPGCNTIPENMPRNVHYKKSDSAEDFYFEVPTGWIDAPPSFLKGEAQQFWPNEEVDFGYQPNPVEAISTYPLLLGKKIQILPDKKRGIYDLAMKLEGVHPGEIINASSPYEVNSALKSLKVKEVVVDTTRQVFFRDNLDIKEGVMTRTRSAFIQSDTEILILKYIDVEANFESNARTRNRFFESLTCKSTVSRNSATSFLDQNLIREKLTKSYRADGYPWPDGLDFQISYPNDWMHKDKKIGSDVRRGVGNLNITLTEYGITYSVSVYVGNSGVTPSQAVSSYEYAKLKTLPESLPKGVIDVQLKMSQLESIPTASRRYLEKRLIPPTLERSQSVPYITKVWESIFLFDGNEFRICCATSAIGNQETEVKNAHTLAEPIFNAIVNSFVLFNLYE